MPQLRVGISGWTYAPWRGTFYPKGLVQKRELEFASRAVNSIEINGSFYSLQRPESYRLWREQTPEGFVFSVKGGRFITHMKKLRDVRTPLANFFASGVLALAEKLGPFLWQLPPSLGYDRGRLETFFAMLPRDTASAAKLARDHDDRLADRSLTRTDENRPLRHAIEVRHDTFKTPEFVALLREHDVALVVADTAGKWPFMEDVTAGDFVYVRLHGDEQLYVSGYTDPALNRWAAKVTSWAAGSDAPGAELVGPPAKPLKRGRDVFVYFDNDVKVRAPYDAIGLARRVGIEWGEGVGSAAFGEVREEARESWPAVRRGRKK
ncbi:MAG TPA: DUF72 domain-containing protein [Tepidisphaeraceae bacterium]|nr:DUF72 domain-containing protein [Tepidisphaeraceae bacterium]